MSGPCYPLEPRPSCPPKASVTFYYKCGDENNWDLVRMKNMDRVSPAERAVMVTEVCSSLLHLVNTWFYDAVKELAIDNWEREIEVQMDAIRTLITMEKVKGLEGVMKEFVKKTGSPQEALTSELESILLDPTSPTAIRKKGETIHEDICFFLVQLSG